MKTGPRHLPASRIRVGLVSVTLLAAGCSGSDGPSGESATTDTGDAMAASSSGDVTSAWNGNALVELRSLTRLDRFEIRNIENVVYELDLGDVVTFATNEADPDTPPGPPAAPLTAFEASLSGQFVLDGFEEGPIDDQTVLVVLGWSAGGEQAETAATAWSLQAAMTEDADGRIRFLGPSAGSSDTDFALLREAANEIGALADATDRLLIARVVDELTAGYGDTGDRGELLTAYDELRRPPTSEEEWYALPPRERPLDVELTPADVRDTLVTRTLLVEVDEDFADAALHLTIRSDDGISFAATMESSRLGTPLLPSTGDLEIHLTGGANDVSTTIGREWFSADTATFLEVGDALAATNDEDFADRIDAGLSTLDDGEYLAVLDRWAAEG